MPIIGRKIKVFLERFVNSTDSIGGTVQTYTQIAELYGSFQTRRGEERLGNAKTVGITSHVFYCQLPTNILGKHNLDMFHTNTEGILPSDRLRYGTRLFNIITINAMSWYFQLELIEKF